LWVDLVVLVLPLFATFGGVVLGFELERRREEKRRKERLFGGLQMIKDEVKKNVDLCAQIENDFATHGCSYVQYYSLKTTTWEAVSGVLVDLRSPELTRQIASEYYEYDHMKRKIDARFDLFKSGMPTPKLTTFANLTKAVEDGARSLKESGERLLQDMDNGIKALGRRDKGSMRSQATGPIRGLLSNEDVSFIINVAVVMFAVSLTFSAQLSYTELKVFPTIIFYRSAFCLGDRQCLASLFFDAFNFISLLFLGAFHHYRSWLIRRWPGGFKGFTAYLIFGAFVGILPWIVYLFTHAIVCDLPFGTCHDPPLCPCPPSTQ